MLNNIMQENWKTRIIAAIDADARSDRAISLAAQLGENFVNQLRNSNRSPSIDKLEKLISVLNLSYSYVFLGYDISSVDEDLLTALRCMPKDSQEALLKLIRANLK